MPNSHKLPITHQLSGSLSEVEAGIDEDGEPIHESCGDLRLDPASYGRRIQAVGNPDDEGCGDRFGERSFKGLEATAAFDRLNDHPVCGGNTDFRSSLDNLFGGQGADADFRFK